MKFYKRKKDNSLYCICSFRFQIELEYIAAAIHVLKENKEKINKTKVMRQLSDLIYCYGLDFNGYALETLTFDPQDLYDAKIIFNVEANV